MVVFSSDDPESLMPVTACQSAELAFEVSTNEVLRWSGCPTRTGDSAQHLVENILVQELEVHLGTVQTQCACRDDNKLSFFGGHAQEPGGG